MEKAVGKWQESGEQTHSPVEGWEGEQQAASHRRGGAPVPRAGGAVWGNAPGQAPCSSLDSSSPPLALYGERERGGIVEAEPQIPSLLPQSTVLTTSWLQ